VIPPFIQQIIGAIVRAAVLWGAGYLAAHAGITLTDSQTTKIIEYLVPVLAVLAWSIYQKYFNRQKLVTAQAMPAGVTEAHIEAKIAAGGAPSVLGGKNDQPL